MHERKARMADLADAFVALPGGAGTLEELFEAWTWGQLGLHAKPVAIADFDGFYQPMIAQLNVMAAAGYISRRLPIQARCRPHRRRVPPVRRRLPAAPARMVRPASTRPQPHSVPPAAPARPPERASRTSSRDSAIRRSPG